MKLEERVKDVQSEIEELARLQLGGYLATATSAGVCIIGAAITAPISPLYGTALLLVPAAGFVVAGYKGIKKLGEEIREKEKVRDKLLEDTDLRYEQAPHTY